MTKLVDVVGGTQSIEGWSREVLEQYHAGNRRPEKIVLILDKSGDKYHGEIYITKEDFETRYR